MTFFLTPDFKSGGTPGGLAFLKNKNRVCHKSMTHPIFYDGGLLLRKPFSILIVFCEILVGEEVGLAG